MSDDAKQEYPRLRVLFIRRARPPFQGAWALPGGFVEPTETVGEAAARELAEETSLTGLLLEQIGCFSRPGRDPRGWVVSVAHLATVSADHQAKARAGDDAAATAWLDLLLEPGGGFLLEHEGVRVDLAAGGLAFDHVDIVAAAVARLRGW